MMTNEMNSAEGSMKIPEKHAQPDIITGSAMELQISILSTTITGKIHN